MNGEAIGGLKSIDRAFVAPIVSVHVEEASFLWLLRDRAVSAPHLKLDRLARLDNRVEAHIDGLRVAGDAGWELLVEQLAHEESGEVFAAGLLALESRDAARIGRVLEVAERAPETTRGFVSALGWVERTSLHGTVKGFLDSESAFFRRLGIAACAVHRVDPGAALSDALAVTLRPVHGLAATLGVICVLAPIWQLRCEERLAGNALFAWCAALWPVSGFLLSFSLIASREAVPFLYFQF